VFLRDGQIIQEIQGDGVDEIGQRLRLIVSAMEELQL